MTATANPNEADESYIQQQLKKSTGKDLSLAIAQASDDQLRRAIDRIEGHRRKVLEQALIERGRDLDGVSLSDQELGHQLTAQYRRAVSGMREVLAFGAMLWQVENTLSNVDKVSVRGRVTDGNGLKGGGLKGWLEQYAPEISRPTAYRFLGIAKAVAEEYETIVGARVAKTYDLPALVLAKTEDLPQHAQLKQGELFEFVSGTSQRSWLDQFKGDSRSNNGGSRERPNGTKRRTADEKSFDDREHTCLEWHRYGWAGLVFMHLHADQSYQHLPDTELANVADILRTIAADAAAHCKLRGVVPSKVADWKDQLSEES